MCLHAYVCVRVPFRSVRGSVHKTPNTRPDKLGEKVNRGVLLQTEGLFHGCELCISKQTIHDSAGCESMFTLGNLILSMFYLLIGHFVTEYFWACYCCV